MDEEANHKNRILQDENEVLKTRITKLQEELHNSNVTLESLKSDKSTVS